MNELKCYAEDCTEVFRTRESLAPGSKYTCRNHATTAENLVRFQDHQFDKGLKRFHAPEGTHHLMNKGRRKKE